MDQKIEIYFYFYIFYLFCVEILMFIFVLYGICLCNYLDYISPYILLVHYCVKTFDIIM